jgi:6-pyruvoyltetrahydropterin/6-carboxytetrahydropterin synthase
VALFTAQAEALDGIGRVVDFSVLKERLGGWIEENWDHGFIYWVKDPEMAALFVLSKIPTDFGEHNGEFKSYSLPENPTAENMAAHLLHKIAPTELQGTGIWLNKVQLWETENCYATAEL